jgi:hypothetical protein
MRPLRLHVPLALLSAVAATAGEVPAVTPITTPAALQARLRELRSLRKQTLAVNPEAAKRLDAEMLALAAASMKAAAVELAGTPTYREMVVLAGGAYDPGDEGPVLPAAFRPLAEEVAVQLRGAAAEVPAEAGPQGLQVRMNCLLLASAVHRAAGRADLAERDALAARSLVDDAGLSGVQLAQAAARKAHALAVLAREERQGEGVGFPGPASCRTAEELLDEALTYLSGGLRSALDMYRARGMKERQLKRISEKLRAQVGDLTGLREKAVACADAPAAAGALSSSSVAP